MILPTKFWVNWPFRPKYILKMADMVVILALSYFYLQVVPILPTKFPVDWPSVQEKNVKRDLQDGCHGSQFGFSIWTILVTFIWKSMKLRSSNEVSSQLAFSNFELDFENGSYGGHLGFPIGMILAIFFFFFFFFFLCTSCSDVSYRFQSTGLSV